MNTLKSRITGAEQTADLEESPIAALFKRTQQAAEPQPEDKPPAPAAPIHTSSSSRIADLPVDILDDMEQPFRRYSDKKMVAFTEDIRKRGIIHRIVVRPHPEQPGRYQIISGRHRRQGAKLAGYVQVPCEIRELDDTEARLQMISANLEQRDELLPSEKAWAYREQMELLRRKAGRPAKGNSPQTAGNFETADKLGAEAGESGDTVYRYVRLTYLTPELLEAVDAGNLGFGVGVTLSYLSRENQEAVYDYFFVTHKLSINGALADTLRASDEKGVTLTAERLAVILAPAVPVKRFNKVSVPMKQLRSYFPAEATPKEVEKRIVEIVRKYFEEGNQ